MVGAPYLDGESFLSAVRRHEHPGVALQAIRFLPTFDKWANQTCGGLAIHILDPPAIRSVSLTMAIVDAARQLAPEQFTWLPPPYEYENIIPPIDILFGSDHLRNRIRGGDPLSQEQLNDLNAFDVDHWRERTSPHLIYNTRLIPKMPGLQRPVSQLNVVFRMS